MKTIVKFNRTEAEQLGARWAKCDFIYDQQVMQQLCIDSFAFDATTPDMPEVQSILAPNGDAAIRCGYIGSIYALALQAATSWTNQELILNGLHGLKEIEDNRENVYLIIAGEIAASNPHIACMLRGDDLNRLRPSAAIAMAFETTEDDGELSYAFYDYFRCVHEIDQSTLFRVRRQLKILRNNSKLGLRLVNLQDNNEK